VTTEIAKVDEDFSFLPVQARGDVKKTVRQYLDDKFHKDLDHLVTITGDKVDELFATAQKAGSSVEVEEAAKAAAQAAWTEVFGPSDDS
jgi:hypothetical protein